VAVVRSLLDGGSAWLAVIVALNAVVGLAYYVRVATGLFSPFSTAPVAVATPVPVAAAVAGSARVDFDGGGVGGGSAGRGSDGSVGDGSAGDGSARDGSVGAGGAVAGPGGLPGLGWAVGLAL